MSVIAELVREHREIDGPLDLLDESLAACSIDLPSFRRVTALAAQHYRAGGRIPRNARSASAGRGRQTGRATRRSIGDRRTCGGLSGGEPGGGRISSGAPVPGDCAAQHDRRGAGCFPACVIDSPHYNSAMRFAGLLLLAGCSLGRLPGRCHAPIEPRHFSRVDRDQHHRFGGQHHARRRGHGEASERCRISGRRHSGAGPERSQGQHGGALCAAPAPRSPC